MIETKKIIIASGNRHKFEEISSIMSEILPDNYQLVFGKTITDIMPEETGDTFFDNALIKAKYFCELSEFPAIGDDTGLCVSALDNAPGVYSARFAGENASYDDNVNKLLTEIAGIPENDRQAYFICTAILYLPNGEYFATEGRIYGSIIHDKRGFNGFGYDPVFLTECGKTLAELDSDVKNSISHRSAAFRSIAKICLEKL